METGEHEHIWEDRWFPYSKTEKWRQCVIPGCTAKEVRKAQ